MAVAFLSIRDFRNHTSYSVELGSGITIFTGPNGAGKTTLLESVALLGSARSFRMAKTEDLIRRGAERAQLVATVNRGSLQDEIRADIQPGGKRFYLNSKYLRSFRGLLEILPCVVFSPGDHKIVDGDATDRRAFLNRAMSGFHPGYADVLADYNKVLQQRNQLLKQASERGLSISLLTAELEPWDSQLIRLGRHLLEQRSVYIHSLQEKIHTEYQRISGKSEDFHITYQPLGEIEESYEQIMEVYPQKLADSLRRDLITESTQIGPHKDEILLTLNGNKVKFYGSQGEKRTCVLALRLGEVALFKEQRKMAPLLLIDDVSSELDADRRRALVELLRSEDSQVMITATELPSALMKDLERPYVHVDLQSIRKNP